MVATTCTTDQLRSLVTSNWWASVEAVCRVDEEARDLDVAVPWGVRPEMWSAFRAHCREHSSIRFTCAMSEPQRASLLATAASTLRLAINRRGAMSGYCGARTQWGPWIESAPDEQQPPLRAALSTLDRFCEMAPPEGAQAAPGSLPIVDARGMELLEELYAISMRARVAGQTPQSASVRAMWSGSAPTRVPTTVPALPRTTPRVTYGSTRVATSTTSSATSAPGATASSATVAASTSAAPLATQDANATSSMTNGAQSSAAPMGASASAQGVMDIAIQGLTQLLVSRAQAEVEAFALEQLRVLLCSSRARPWFEHTCGYLVDAGRNTSLRVSLGAGLRTAFQADVLALPARAAQQAPRAGGGTALVYRTFFELVTQFIASPDTRSLSTVVTSVADTFRCANEPALCEQMRRAMMGSGLMLLAVATRPDLERMPHEVFHSFLETLLGRKPVETDRALVGELRLAGQRLRNAFGSITLSASSVDVQLPRIGAVARSLIEVINLASRLAANDADIASLVALPDRLAQLVLAIGRGNLPHIVIETVRIVSAIGRAGFGLPDNVARGLVLAAEIAQAQSPEQVRAALETVVAPVGSWRIKRTRFTLSLSAMVGLSGGGDYIVGGGVTGQTQLVPSVGLTGMLGLDVSFPIARTHTLGVFASAIDVGGLMSFPIQPELSATVRDAMGNTRTTTLQFNSRVSPEQILSPGLFFRWGVGQTPFIVGAGASVIPNGRRVEAVGMTFQGDVSIVRVQGFLAVDVTLFPF
ncbi:MAG: hypothetical protein JNK05_09430 [Myxococcales bacterium]|nr:hypothetical protein [Myxococcales bacterium]